MALTLEDFSDYDLLYALEDAADDHGWATAEDTGRQTGLSQANLTKSIAIRFAWQRRFGLVEYGEDERAGQWCLTRKGRELLYPRKLTAAAERALAGLDDGQRAAVTDVVASGLARGSRESAHLTRRAWKYQTASFHDPSITPKRKARV